MVVLCLESKVEEAVVSSSIPRPATGDIGRHTALVDEHLREEQRGINLELRCGSGVLKDQSRGLEPFNRQARMKTPRLRLRDVW